jgi:uncharacterized membrane protein YeaQ/YmgE (transglycosylase-associated protein family)
MRSTDPFPVTVNVGGGGIVWLNAGEDAASTASTAAASVILFMTKQRTGRTSSAPFHAKRSREGIGHGGADGAASNRRKRKGQNRHMDIISWLIVGLIAGFLAKYVVPGEGPGGVLGDIIIGIIGAFIGGFVFNAFGHTGTTGLNVWSIIVAFVGAVILLFILRAISGRRASY